MQTVTTTDAARKAQARIDTIDKRRANRTPFDGGDDSELLFVAYGLYVFFIGGIGAAIAGAIGNGAIALVVFVTIAAIPPVALLAYGVYRLYEYVCYRRAKKTQARLGH